MALNLMVGKGNGVNSRKQLRSVLSHPLSSLSAVKEDLDARGLLLGKLIVGPCAWDNIQIADTVVLVAAIAFAALISAYDPGGLTWCRRALLLSTDAHTDLAVRAGLYMGFTPVGA